MEPSERTTLPEDDRLQPEAQQSRPNHHRIAKRGYYLAAGVIACLVILFVTFVVITGTLRIGPPTVFLKPTPAVLMGPRLNSVTDLPADTAGRGTIQGTPTGAATSDNNGASFILMLDPAPAGLPARTTLGIYFDHSTKAYRGTRLLSDDPLTGMNAMPGPNDADPTAAGSVTVHFHIKNGKVFADRLDLE